MLIYPYRLFVNVLKDYDEEYNVAFRRYKRLYLRQLTAIARIQFLTKCLNNDLIPRFLKFRIPANGAFTEKAEHQFQRRLLRSEIHRAREAVTNHRAYLNNERRKLCGGTDALLATISFHVRREGRWLFRNLKTKHQQKLNNLSKEQEKPLKSTDKTIIVEEGVAIPETISNLLSYRPKHPVVSKVNQKLPSKNRAVCI